jgi:hypothetical protein
MNAKLLRVFECQPYNKVFRALLKKHATLAEAQKLSRENQGFQTTT